MQKSGILRYFIILALAVAGSVAFYLAPPSTKNLSILPSHLASKPIETLTDAVEGGKTIINVSHTESSIRVQAVLDTQSQKSPWAGIAWDLDQNWMFADTLRLMIRAQGATELELKVRTFDPDYSKKETPSTFKVLIKEIPVNNKMHEIAIPVEHLYIPEWWYAQAGANPKHDIKYIDMVRRIDITFSSKTPRGVPVEFEIQSAVLEGGTSRNMAIYVGFLFILMLIVAGTNPHKKRPRE